LRDSPHWQQDVLHEFSRAAPSYDAHARLQRAVAWRLAALCQRLPIRRGLWVDLGSGTGLLAEALEALHPGQRLTRLDGSQAMLTMQPAGSTTLLWRLQDGLPPWQEPPRLLASSFCLHWLEQPDLQLEHWYRALAPGDWLAVALPVEGSFPQWHAAARVSGERCSAHIFPNPQDLVANLPVEAIHHNRCYRFSQQASSAVALLRPMRQIGAGSSPCTPLGVGGWRRLERCWPDRNSNGQIRLTWLIQILLLRR
jgi:malonyl-CoA O-methyltransferase